MNRNADTLDAAVLHYLIVYRSRMRMIDLWRSVAEVQDTAGYVKFQEGILRSSLSYRLPLMIQVAVEEVLRQPGVQELLEKNRRRGNLDFQEVVKDSLYYLADKWEGKGDWEANGNTAVVISSNALQTHLENLRSQSNHGKDPSGTATSTQEFRFANALPVFVELVERVASFLANPVELVRQIEKAEDRSVPIEVIDAIPMEPLLVSGGPEVAQNADVIWFWNYDTDGSVKPDRPAVKTTRKQSKKLLGGWDCYYEISSVDEVLREASNHSVTLASLADEWPILSSSPAWPQVQQAMLSLGFGEADGVEERRENQSDEVLVKEYHTMLEKRMETLEHAIMAARILGKAKKGGSDEAESLAEGLNCLVQGVPLHRLSGSERKERLVNRFILVADMVSAAIRRKPTDYAGRMKAILRYQLVEFSAEEYQRTAWETQFERFRENMARRGELLPTTFEELVCDAAEIQPALLFPPNANSFSGENVSLAQWSSAFFDALSDSSPEDRGFCPVWVAAVALYHLGFGSQISRFAAQLLKSMDRGELDSEDTRLAAELKRVSGYESSLSKPYSRWSEAAVHDERPISGYIKSMFQWGRYLEESGEGISERRNPVLLMPNSPDSNWLTGKLPSDAAVFVLPSQPTQNQLQWVSLLFDLVGGEERIKLMVETSKVHSDPNYMAVLDSLSHDVDLCFVHEANREISTRSRIQTQIRTGQAFATVEENFFLPTLLKNASGAIEDLHKRRERQERLYNLLPLPVRTAHKTMKQMYSRLMEPERATVSRPEFKGSSGVAQVDDTAGEGDFRYQFVKRSPVPNVISHANVYSVATDEHGRVLVGTDAEIPITVFSLADDETVSFGAGVVGRPQAICVGPEGNVFVADSQENQARIYRFSSSGRKIASYGKSGRMVGFGQDSSPTKALKGPNGIAIGRNRDLFVSDGYGNAAIQVWRGGRKTQTKFGRPGDGDGQLWFPSGLAFSGDGSLIVADRENNRVQVFTDRGKFKMEWTDLHRPCSVAIDKRGFVYVCELGAQAKGGTIAILDHQGSRQARVSHPNPSCRWFPVQLAVAHNGDLFVVAIEFTKKVTRDELQELQKENFNPTESKSIKLYHLKKIDLT